MRLKSIVQIVFIHTLFNKRLTSDFKNSCGYFKFKIQNIAMSSKALVIVTAIALSCSAQRSPYAGRRPIGYPEMDTTTTTESALGNRFGEDGQTTTTERLPIEANGDRELVNRLSKLPIDKQPFWFINWKALEEHRKKPISYDLRPSPFLNQNSQLEQGRRILQENSIQGTVDPIVQGGVDPINKRRMDPEVQERVDPINQRRMDPINQRRMNPINQRRMDPVAQERVDPINQRRMDPINQRRIDPVVQKIMDPLVQGRLSNDLKGQNRRPITNSPPTNWQGSVDDFSSMDDSSAMFFY